MYAREVIAAVAFSLPLALACNGQPEIPEATETISNTEPIYVGEGEVFDGAGARYDRGAGACNGQNEGG